PGVGVAGHPTASAQAGDVVQAGQPALQVVGVAGAHAVARVAAERAATDPLAGLNGRAAQAALHELLHAIQAVLLEADQPARAVGRLGEVRVQVERAPDRLVD